jgi:chromosome segregation ATPase
VPVNLKGHLARMNDNWLTELKNFITVTVTETVSREIATVRMDISELRYDFSQLRNDVSGLRRDVDNLQSNVNRLDKKVNILDKKVDDLTLAVAEALDTSNEANTDQLRDHEQRIAHLEHKTA